MTKQIAYCVLSLVALTNYSYAVLFKNHSSSTAKLCDRMTPLYGINMSTNKNDEGRLNDIIINSGETNKDEVTSFFVYYLSTSCCNANQIPIQSFRDLKPNTVITLHKNLTVTREEGEQV